MTHRRTELLPGGETLTIGGAAPEDGPAVAAMHRRCSLDTVFRRYLTAVPQLSPTLQARLLALPVTLLAQHGRDVVGMAHLAEQPGHPAEVAVLVEDAWQRRGVGGALVDAVLVAAAARGHTEVVACTLPSSTAVHALARRLRGGRLAPSFHRGDDGLVTVTLHLASAHGRPRALSA